MDEKTKELIAIGASAAVNCRPCLRYHVGQGERAGLTPEEIAASVDVGMFVNRGAAEQTRTFTNELLNRSGTEEVKAQQPACAGSSKGCC